MKFLSREGSFLLLQVSLLEVKLSFDSRFGATPPIVSNFQWVSKRQVTWRGPALNHMISISLSKNYFVLLNLNNVFFCELQKSFSICRSFFVIFNFQFCGI